MRITSLLVVCYALVGSLASAQTPTLHGYTTYLPVKTGPVTGVIQPGGVPSVAPLPTWTYSITADASLGGGTYTGTVIGRSPYSRGKTTTTIPTQIIPLVITITDTNGTIVYDPTTVDAPCVPGHTVVDIINNSPVFTNNTWTMNGVNVGNTQYLDAFQRAEFWSLVSGTSYHLLLSPTTLGSQALAFGTGHTYGGSNFPSLGTCDPVGVVNVNDMDTIIQSLITGPLASTVNVGTFPIFLTKNVVMAESGTSLYSDCCILGYHSGFTSGPNLQVYSPFSIDTAQAFGAGYTSAFSHEIGEAINDPNTANATPNWGNIGQVEGSCQANFEVGDPLSPGFGTPTNEWVVAGANGISYHLQELAFYSWFFGGPSTATSTTSYSDNGTFTGFAKLCPPGGTN